MNIENKKQIAIMLLAIGLGLVAAILTGNHIKTSIERETAKLATDFENKKMKPLMREISLLQKEVKELASRPVMLAGAGGPGGPGTPSIPTSSLALRTPPGKRAYTVRIDALSAVGGLINPGDFIDIIGHLEMPDPVEPSKTEKVSSLVFQNVQILAVGTNLQAPGGYEQQQNSRSLNITFALTPEESGLLSFIEKNGKMQLILRAPQETEIEIIQAATWSSLADYVFEKQGTELIIPRASSVLSPLETEGRDVKPFIQIFRGGREL